MATYKGEPPMKPKDLIVKVQRKADTLGTKINAAEVSRVIALAFAELSRLDQSEAFGVLSGFAKLAAKHKASAKGKAKAGGKGKAKSKVKPKATAKVKSKKRKTAGKKKAASPELTVMPSAAA